MPDGAELAWFVYKRAHFGVAKKYGLQDTALSSLGLELTAREFRDLMEKLEAIELGMEDARKQLKSGDG